MVKRNSISLGIFILVTVVILTVYINKPINILKGSKEVEVVKIYDIDSKRSKDLSSISEINKLINNVKNASFKREKLVGNSSAEGSIISFYDINGDVIDTIYTLDENFIYHHWKVRLIGETNPFEGLNLKIKWNRYKRYVKIQ